jgi:putative ABC transport system ATP-binding protein
MSLFELDAVSKRFTRGYAEILALDRVSLRLDAGDFVAVWGRSNSGKTTLLRVAAGIERPDEGSVRFDGRDLSEMSRRERARLLLHDIGCVWRTAAVPRGLSVVDYVALPLLRTAGRRSARQQAIVALSAAGLTGCSEVRWHELADGDRARVAIAHALVRRPRLVLADEPSANLNIVEREEVLGLLRSEAEDRGTAVLMTAPDAPDTLQSRRVCSIDRGRLIEPERPSPGTLIDFPERRRADV